MKNFKKFLTCSVSAALVAVSAQAFAAEDIKLFADGNLLNCDVLPVTDENNVFIPFRALFESLGLEVSYDETSDSVSATKGGTWIYFEAGADTISTDEGEFKLSAPIKLINDRCFVPLDAVYEGLGYAAEWDKEKNTVEISTKIGDHDIKEEIISKEIKAEDGTVIMRLKASYPVFESKENGEGAKKVCKKLKASAEKAVEITEDLTEIANDTYNAMKSEDREFSPCETETSFKVTYDKCGIISLKYTAFSDFKGAHPITAVYSETYDLKSGNKLEFEDIFGDEALGIIKNAFADKIKAAPEAYFEDAEKTVGESDESLKNNFYLKDGGAVFYFNVYEIAPYAAGLQTAKVVLSSGAFGDEFLSIVK